jgi:hypothetical protein
MLGGIPCMSFSYLGVWNNLLFLLFIRKEKSPSVNSSPGTFNKRALQYSSTSTCMYIPSDSSPSHLCRPSGRSCTHTQIRRHTVGLGGRREFELLLKDQDKLVDRVPVDKFRSSTFMNMAALSSFLASPKAPCQDKQTISMAR